MLQQVAQQPAMQAHSAMQGQQTLVVSEQTRGQLAGILYDAIQAARAMAMGPPAPPAPAVPSGPIAQLSEYGLVPAASFPFPPGQLASQAPQAALFEQPTVSRVCVGQGAATAIAAGPGVPSSGELLGAIRELTQALRQGHQTPNVAPAGAPAIAPAGAFASESMDTGIPPVQVGSVGPRGGPNEEPWA